MCLITVSPKGTNKYNDEFINGIKNGAKYNTDGYGYMLKYPDQNYIHYNKDFDNINDLINEITLLGIPDEAELVVHSRTGNKGAKTKVNAHPFMVTDSSAELEKLTGFSDFPMLCHNGTFYNFGEHNSKFSDTYHFVKQFMCIPEFIQLMCRDLELFKAVFSTKLETYNKLAFLFPDRAMLLIGDFIESNGYYYSNSAYKNSEYKDVGGVNKTFLVKRHKEKTYITSEILLREIDISEYTKDEIYLVCKKEYRDWKVGSCYLVSPNTEIKSTDSALFIYEVDSKTASEGKVAHKLLVYNKYSDLVFPKELPEYFTVLAKNEFKEKYEDYKLLKAFLHDITNGKLKKLFKVYNNTIGKARVEIRVDNKAIHIFRSVVQILLFKYFDKFKNSSHHVTLIERELEDYSKNNTYDFMDSEVQMLIGM